MRLWISKNSEVPLREQLTTQLMLGIVSNDLKSNQRLPSTRELARRFQIHSNTISAAYRELAKRGWVEFRKGSGVYVRARGSEPLQSEPALDGRLELDQLISQFLKSTRQKGYSLHEIQTRLKDWLQMQPPDHFLVIESDIELRNILVQEISEATDFPVHGIGEEDCASSILLTGSVPLVMYGRYDEVRARLPAHLNFLTLHAGSIQQGLERAKLVPPNASIIVISQWPEFLRWGRAIISTDKLASALISFRSPLDEGWQEGLTRNNTFVVTDLLTSKKLPRGCRSLVFHIIAESSLDELRNIIG